MLQPLLRLLARIPGAQVTVDEDREREERVRSVELFVDSLVIRAETLEHHDDEGRAFDAK